jgi:chaperonin GroES
MSFKACGDRVFVRPDKAADRTRGGLIIPDVAKERPKQGIVVYAGPGMLMKTGARWPMPVKPGDRILYTDNAFPEIEIAGEKLLAMHDNDVIAVVENDR